MMEEKRLVPKKRFKNYKDDWDGRQINMIAEINPKSTLPGEFKYVDLESVKGTSLISYKAITRENAPSRAQRLAKYNDVFYQTVRPYQMNNYRHSLKEGNFVFSTGYAQIRPSIDSKFLISKMITNEFVNKVMDRCTGTSFPAINSDDLSKIEFYIPLDEGEQQKIGEFFKVLDERIANQERKIAKVKALKEAYLTEMFPQKGETVPKRRFNGFEGEWQMFKLEDIAEITTGYAFSSIDFTDEGEYLVITNKNIKDQEKEVESKGDKINIDDRTILDNYSLKGVNVLVTMDGVNIGETGKYSDNKALLAQRVGRITSDSTQIEFIYQLTKRTKFSDEMHKVSVGNAIKHISLKQISEHEFYAPKSERERFIIGSFFKNLDDQIRAEEAKLEKLKKMKEAYLEEMFV